MLNNYTRMDEPMYGGSTLPKNTQNENSTKKMKKTTNLLRMITQPAVNGAKNFAELQLRIDGLGS